LDDFGHSSPTVILPWSEPSVLFFGLAPGLQQLSDLFENSLAPDITNL